MENPINMSDQNAQQMGQNPVGQPVQSPEKAKTNCWMISIIVLALLLVAISTTFFLVFKSQWSDSNFALPGVTNKPNNLKIYLHRANNSSQLLDSSSPDYQKIKDITSRIINPSLNLAVEDRVKITLIVEQDRFLKSLEQSDYVGIQPEQPFQDKIEQWEYDKIVFILRGGYSGMIFGHSSKYKGEPRNFWYPWWGPTGEGFWSLGEFLGVPTPTPSPPGQTGRQSQTISNDILQTENQGIILAELQRLNIETKDRWEQSNIQIPPDLSGADWGLKKQICKEGGYDLSAYAGKTLSFTSYLTNEVWNEKESLLVWILSDKDKIACVYKSVLPGRDITPGIFSVKENSSIQKR